MYTKIHGRRVLSSSLSASKDPGYRGGDACRIYQRLKSSAYRGVEVWREELIRYPYRHLTTVQNYDVSDYPLIIDWVQIYGYIVYYLNL
ncbi:hypothetical protein TNCV_3386311 [Trichonephila clavipes]|nr:hypothetical protein TNCV_3386311 [Trichonephila clavipes]